MTNGQKKTKMEGRRMLRIFFVFSLYLVTDGLGSDLFSLYSMQRNVKKFVLENRCKIFNGHSHENVFNVSSSLIDVVQSKGH
jgi:hypothetical protein